MKVESRGSDGYDIRLMVQPEEGGLDEAVLKRFKEKVRTHHLEFVDEQDCYQLRIGAPKNENGGQ